MKFTQTQEMRTLTSKNHFLLQFLTINSNQLHIKNLKAVNILFKTLLQVLKAYTLTSTTLTTQILMKILIAIIPMISINILF